MFESATLAVLIILIGAWAWKFTGFVAQRGLEYGIKTYEELKREIQ